MSDEEVLTDRILTQSVVTATIHAPIDKLDIATWLLNLPDKEYQRCAPPDHKAAGYTSTDDGRPMSISPVMTEPTALPPSPPWSRATGQANSPHSRGMLVTTESPQRKWRR